MNTVETLVQVAVAFCNFTGLSHFSKSASQLLAAVLVAILVHHAIHLCKRHLRLPTKEALAASLAALTLLVADCLWVVLQTVIEGFRQLV